MKGTTHRVCRSASANAVEGGARWSLFLFRFHASSTFSVAHFYKNPSGHSKKKGAEVDNYFNFLRSTLWACTLCDIITTGSTLKWYVFKYNSSSRRRICFRAPAPLAEFMGSRPRLELLCTANNQLSVRRVIGWHVRPKRTRNTHFSLGF